MFVVFGAADNLVGEFIAHCLTPACSEPMSSLEARDQTLPSPTLALASLFTNMNDPASIRTAHLLLNIDLSVSHDVDFKMNFVSFIKFAARDFST